MNAAEHFDSYLEHLSAGLGHMDRHAGLRGYCTGLMLPLSRKSVLRTDKWRRHEKITPPWAT